jgi:hypothetical protein
MKPATNASHRRRETQFSRTETKTPKRPLQFNGQIAETKRSGSYGAGELSGVGTSVYEALAEAGIHLDWIAGITRYSNRVSANAGLRCRETRFCGAETKAPKP